VNCPRTPGRRGRVIGDGQESKLIRPASTKRVATKPSYRPAAVKVPLPEVDDIFQATRDDSSVRVDMTAAP
jgi:hypothetical protein